MTENWVKNEIFCPNCGNLLSEYQANKPVGDFYCKKCLEDYELKSKKDSMGKKITDGAYKTMLERLQSITNPNFFFLNYDLQTYKVINFVVIPKHFFIPEIIIPRKKGIPNRPNYIMCGIDLANIPKSGKIFYVKNKKIESKDKILEEWQKTLFLREEKRMEKGWLLDTMACIEQINKRVFDLQDIYKFESILKTKHPKNNFIKDKLRQQLQKLRDKGYLEFKGKGKYQLT